MNVLASGVAAKQLVGPIASLAERARESHEWVVVYTNDAHQLNDVELRVFPPHALSGTPGAAVVAELRPCADDMVVEKRFYSGFTGTDLGSRLHSQDVGRLVLVGQHTDCCRHTAYDAFRRRLRTHRLPRRYNGVRAGLGRTRGHFAKHGPSST